MWWSKDKASAEKRAVESWVRQTLRLSEMRKHILLSSNELHDKYDKLHEMTMRRTLPMGVLPPFYRGASLVENTEAFSMALTAEGLLSDADWLEDLSIFLLMHASSPHARELGLAFLDMARGKDRIDEQVQERFEERIHMMKEEAIKYLDEFERRMTDRLRVYLRDKGLPESAPLPKEVSMQVVKEVQSELQQPVSEETQKEIYAIYQQLWKLGQDKRSEAGQIIIAIATKYGINPKDMQDFLWGNHD